MIQTTEMHRRTWTALVIVSACFCAILVTCYSVSLAGVVQYYAGSETKMTKCPNGGHITEVFYFYRAGPCNASQEELAGVKVSKELVCTSDNCDGSVPKGCILPSTEPVELVPCVSDAEIVVPTICAGWTAQDLSQAKQLVTKMRENEKSLQGIKLNFSETFGAYLSRVERELPGCKAAQLTPEGKGQVRDLIKKMRDFEQLAGSLADIQKGQSQNMSAVRQISQRLFSPKESKGQVKPGDLSGSQKSTTPSGSRQAAGSESIPKMSEKWSPGTSMSDLFGERGVEGEPGAIGNYVRQENDDGSTTTFHDTNGDEKVDWSSTEDPDGSKTLYFDSDGDGAVDKMATIVDGTTTYRPASSNSLVDSYLESADMSKMAWLRGGDGEVGIALDVNHDRKTDGVAVRNGKSWSINLDTDFDGETDHLVVGYEGEDSHPNSQGVFGREIISATMPALPPSVNPSEYAMRYSELSDASARADANSISESEVNWALLNIVLEAPIKGAVTDYLTGRLEDKILPTGEIIQSALGGGTLGEAGKDTYDAYSLITPYVDAVAPGLNLLRREISREALISYYCADGKSALGPSEGLYGPMSGWTDSGIRKGAELRADRFLKYVKAREQYLQAHQALMKLYGE